MKRGVQAWTWALDVLARSSALVLALAALVALWGFAAYHWLGLPESSALLYLLALVWGLAQLAIVVIVLAGVASGAGAAAARNARSMRLSSLVTFNRSLLLRTTLLAAIAFVLVLAFAEIFSWSEDLALRVASLFTFISEKAYSPMVIGKILWVIETALWVMLVECLSSFLMVLLRSGWKEAWRERRRLFADCCCRIPFLTGILSLVVFGGLAYFLATSHPTVTPGFWDYAQLVLRMGGALLLLVIGWIFLMLSLARLILPPEEATSRSTSTDAPAATAPGVSPTP